jgi:hypothetical protein
VGDTVDLVEFKSPAFAPTLPDECQVNPGRYGAELAFWLCQKLAVLGVVTSYPEYEDWGWYLTYHAPSGAEFALNLGNIDGTTDTWSLSLERFRQKVFRRSSFAEASALVDGVRRVLQAESSVSDLQWTYPASGPA